MFTRVTRFQILAIRDRNTEWRVSWLPSSWKRGDPKSNFSWKETPILSTRNDYMDMDNDEGILGYSVIVGNRVIR